MDVHIPTLLADDNDPAVEQVEHVRIGRCINAVAPMVTVTCVRAAEHVARPQRDECRRIDEAGVWMDARREQTAQPRILVDEIGIE
jgi:hypothetical protein